MLLRCCGGRARANNFVRVCESHVQCCLAIYQGLRQLITFILLGRAFQSSVGRALLPRTKVYRYLSICAHMLNCRRVPSAERTASHVILAVTVSPRSRQPLQIASDLRHPPTNTGLPVLPTLSISCATGRMRGASSRMVTMTAREAQMTE